MSAGRGAETPTRAQANDNEDVQPSILAFANGLPGFGDLRHFTLVRWGADDSPLCLLKSIDRPEIEFVVAPPAVFFPDYEPELDDGTAERLGLSDSEDALMLVILTVQQKPEDATANLMGPIVVNKNTLEAAQVVLANAGYEVRAPLTVSNNGTTSNT
jgi:flagellar assembly factor FliW